MGTAGEINALKGWQTAMAAFVVLLYWIVVLSLPTTADSWPGWMQLLVGVVGAGLLIYGAMKVRKALTPPQGDPAQKDQIVTLGAILVVAGILLILLAFMTRQEMNLTNPRRFAIGVGGTALAGFVYSVTRFDTLRAAASVPVVILLVGVVVWPDADELVADDVRTAIITWMGVILSASGVAEAAKQIGESNAKAKAAPADGSADVTSSGDLAGGGGGTSPPSTG